MNSRPYLAFIWKNEGNREYLLYGLTFCIVQFIVFKILYPFPDFYNDSLWYIWAASENMNISVWPIGYSKFLSVFHFLTSSDDALVGFQYFFMQLTALNFYFTILYFFKTSRRTRNILFFFLIFNPLTLYLSNTVISDALFGALTLLWLTQLIWIHQRPQLQQLVIQAGLLFLCFTIRNTAYYYPFIAVIVFLLSRQSVWRKSIGIALCFLLPLLFIQYSKKAAYEFTGYRQSSLFTGWQLANNALYIYEYISEDSAILVSSEARELNRMAHGFFRGNYFIEHRSSIYRYPGSYFIAQSQGPLKQYFVLHGNAVKAVDKVRNWGKISAIFELFGKSVILNHPLAYIQHFGGLNVSFYFLPPLADLKYYNGGQTTLYPLAREWFSYGNTDTICLATGLQQYLSVYKIIFLLLNIYFGTQMVFFLLKGRALSILKADGFFYLLALTYLSANFFFSIFAAINVLRYQYIPMYILLSGGLLLNDDLARKYTSPKHHRQPDKQLED